LFRRKPVLSKLFSPLVKEFTVSLVQKEIIVMKNISRRDFLKGTLAAAATAAAAGVLGACTSDAVKEAVNNCIAQAKGEPVVSTVPESTSSGSEDYTLPG